MRLMNQRTVARKKERRRTTCRRRLLLSDSPGHSPHLSLPVAGVATIPRQFLPIVPDIAAVQPPIDPVQRDIPVPCRNDGVPLVSAVHLHAASIPADVAIIVTDVAAIANDLTSILPHFPAAELPSPKVGALAHVKRAPGVCR